MLQYKIPQNIGIEDKIVGPLSLRQLIILAVGAGISYVLFAITSRIYELNVLEYTVIAIPTILAVMAALIKVNNVTFTKYILLILEFAIKPKKRIWDHRGIVNLVDPDLRDKTPAKKSAEATAEEGKKDVNVKDISSVLDSGGFEHVNAAEYEDIDEADDDDLITEAYFGHKQKSKEDNMYWRTKDMQKKKLTIMAAKIEKPQSPKTAAPVAAPAPQPQAQAQAQTPTTPARPPAPAKKESVAEGLAKVIQNARDNSETKKKRPRNRRSKTTRPVRQNTQINTTDKNAPNKLMQTTPLAPRQQEEASLGDLKKGGEIEFNLN
jgi:hypothetical protein